MSIDNTEIVAAIAFTGVVFSALLSAFISHKASSKSVYINSVTAERMKWISATRDLILSLNEGLFLFHFRVKNDSKYVGTQEFYKETASEYTKVLSIIVHLNNRGFIEANVVRLARSCYSSAIDAVTSPKDEKIVAKFMMYNNLLAEHSGYLFKQEWERVKLEASGIFYAWYLRRRSARRMRHYEQYASGDGYFEDGFTPFQRMFSPPAQPPSYVWPNQRITHPSSTPR